VLVEHGSRKALSPRTVNARTAAGRPSFSFTPKSQPAPAKPSPDRASGKGSPRKPPTVLLPLAPHGVAAAVSAVPALGKMASTVSAIGGKKLSPWTPLSSPVSLPHSGTFSGLFGGGPGVDASPGDTFDSAAIVAQSQVLLAALAKAGAPIDPPDYGTTTSDLDGDSSAPRFGRAVSSFQRAWNGSGQQPRLADDGQLDLQTYSALVTAGAAALAPHAAQVAPAPAAAPPATSGSTGLVVALGAAALAYVFRKQIFGGRS
jgi:hypothetical protein